MAEAPSWQAVLRAYRHPRVVTMLFLGFSAGLPLLLIFSSLSIWLREAEVSRSSVTYFSWAALAYSFKFIWAPLVDRLPVPLLSAWLGRRRGWLLLAQLGVIASICWMALTDPADQLVGMALAAIALGFCGATQDIVIDAYRIESADKRLQALMSSSYIAGYRIGMLVAGAGALKLAALFGGDGGYSYVAWQWTYLVMALVMLVGVVTTLVVAEPQLPEASLGPVFATADYVRFLVLFLIAAAMFGWAFFYLGGHMMAEAGSSSGGLLMQVLRLLLAGCLAGAVVWGVIRLRLVKGAMLRRAYLEPVTDFFSRYGRLALLVLLLIGLYRISDIVLGVIANVFYQDMGFSKDQIADITKTFGLLMTILGGFLGGFLSLRYGVMRILMLGAVLSAATNLLFLLLAKSGSDPMLLIGVVAADNLSAGLASAAFVAYLSSLTQIAFTAFQYAMFTSLMTLMPKLLGGYSGSIVDAFGYERFFLFTALLGVPVLFLIRYVATRVSD